ncbi:hypothetical protein C672_0494 [[Clostridium] bifermentans ATCC 638]|uniref:Uncharacterized protein n=1 Tax=Paraclostridium bifermentans ATCC 638 = DSM 14991 TaxID=1233171 RepID=T4VUP4_PARBF|nr:hypothetical protein C672_0494 [[Clostridium] bifermentans ATCC 638] [Paraclostridium bifermentans ATCC 638 = DSM 14991]
MNIYVKIYYLIKNANKKVLEIRTFLIKCFLIENFFLKT